MSFPKIKYGRCPIHGGKGTNDPAPGSAFSTEDHSGAGYNLVWYKGQLMCEMCKKRLSNDAESMDKAREYNENQKFWDDMGVRKTME